MNNFQMNTNKTISRRDDIINITIVLTVKTLFPSKKNIKLQINIINSIT